MKKLSWGDVEKLTGNLAHQITASGFNPEYLIGITTGGLIPLYFLAKELRISNLLTVSVVSQKNHKNNGQEEPRITYLPEIDLRRKKLLLVDEIVETGISLKTISDVVIKKYQPDEFKTATLGVNTDRCKFYPDFYVIIEQGEWVVFPWEKEVFPQYLFKA